MLRPARLNHVLQLSNQLAAFTHRSSEDANKERRRARLIPFNQFKMRIFTHAINQIHYG